MKYVKMVLFTTLIMAALLGVAGFFAYRGYQADQAKEKQTTREELDMDLYGINKESIAEDTVQSLSARGKKKNVKTLKKVSAKKIYSPSYSSQVKKKLDRWKTGENYTLEQPLWAFNPYGTNELSLYLYFESPKIKKVRCTIHVENDDIPDFTRTLKRKEDTGEAHEYQITGLVPGLMNYIILKGQDESGKELVRAVYSFTPDNIKGKIPVSLTEVDGNSLEEISNGLYFFLGHDSDNAKMPKKILLYDNSGILRGAIPLLGGRCVKVMEYGGNLFYNCSNTKFASVNSLGQVVDAMGTKGYQVVNDYTYDGFGHLYAIATKPGGKTVENRVITLDMASGKVEELLNMDLLLSSIKKKARKPKTTSKLDWIGLNSIEYVGSDGILLSSRELSGIIKVAYVNSVKPKVQYILGDGDLLKELGVKKKYRPKTEDELLQEAREASSEENAGGAKEEEKSGNQGEDSGETFTPGMIKDPESDPFIAQFGQSDVSVSTVSANTATQYQLVMFNNNYGNTPTRKDISWGQWTEVSTKKKQADTSMVYRYQVDEDTRTFRLTDSFPVPFSSYESSVQEYKRHYIVNSGSTDTVSEYDENGSLISQLKYSVKTYTYRVEKHDMKDFWYE